MGGIEEEPGNREVASPPSSQRQTEASVGGTIGSTLGVLAGIPVGGFVSGQVDERGQLSSEAGLGITAGNLSVITVQGIASVQAGPQAETEFASIAALILPGTRTGVLFDARLSLTSAGGRVQVGLIRGAGVLGFLGIVKQGPSFGAHDLLRSIGSGLDQISRSGSGIPGNPGPPPISAIPPF